MPTPTESHARNTGARTYVPDESHRDEIAEFARLVREFDATLAPRTAALRAPDGTERVIPVEIFEVLEQVADVLAAGSGVTVAPNDLLMTTQQGADFLGVSRPTLIKYLESGALPFEKRGRHRRVLLRDLVAYQERFRVERRSALRDVARDGQRQERDRGSSTIG